MAGAARKNSERALPVLEVVCIGGYPSLFLYLKVFRGSLIRRFEQLLMKQNQVICITFLSSFMLPGNDYI
jgi:hypothetical protein